MHQAETWRSSVARANAPSCRVTHAGVFEMNDTYKSTAFPNSASWGSPAPISAAMFDGLAPAPAAVRGSNRPFDVAQILERCLGSRQLVERVLSSFELRFESELEAVRDELSTGDGEALARVAHRLKGACANAAAEELAELSNELETAARAEQFDRARGICDGMSAAWLRFGAASDAFRRGANAESKPNP